MAEMTASEATEILLNLSWMVGTERRSQIAALIEQQAQEIERMNGCLKFEQNYLSRVGTHGPDCYKWGPGHWECAMQEIAKKDRMLLAAIDKLFILPDRDECPDAVFCPITLPNTPDIGVCRKCWRKWLEKEAEAQG